MEKSRNGPGGSIMLVFPNPISTIPTGFIYVAERFRKNGFATKVLINTFMDYKSIDELYKIICSEKPDIVGLSYVTFNLLEIYRLQKMLNQAGILVVAGGIHPTICVEEVLQNGAHFVLRGEGELAIDDFSQWFKSGARAEERRNIRNASFIQDGRAVDNPAATRIMDLDTVGNLNFEGLDLESFRVIDGSIKGLNVILGGRGCPYQCTFCSHRVWERYSCRSVDAMIEDMVQRNKKYGINLFNICEETFTIHKARAIEFCRKLIKEKLGFKWITSTRVSLVDEELLALFKQSGCEQVTYGIESLSDYTLKKIKKGNTAAEAYRGVEMTGKIGLPMYVNLMTGFPWQTVDSVRQDISFIRRMGRYVNCFQLYGAVIPYPDTPIYEEYHRKEGFTEFWVKPRFQNAGMCIYQNVSNPYAVSTYWQRNLYDDTYVSEDYFFKFTPAYKRAVAYMGAIIGWHSVKAATKSPWKKYLRYSLGLASRLFYEVSPTIEKRIVGRLGIRNVLHTKRERGRFIRT